VVVRSESSYDHCHPTSIVVRKGVISGSSVVTISLSVPIFRLLVLPTPNSGECSTGTSTTSLRPINFDVNFDDGVYLGIATTSSY